MDQQEPRQRGLQTSTREKNACKRKPYHSEPIAHALTASLNGSLYLRVLREGVSVLSFFVVCGVVHVPQTRERKTVSLKNMRCAESRRSMYKDCYAQNVVGSSRMRTRRSHVERRRRLHLIRLSKLLRQFGRRRVQFPSCSCRCYAVQWAATVRGGSMADC